MPQYLAPGVYVEEIAGPRTIQGVSTSTAAFIGPTRFGPTSGRPELLSSYLDFARIYGDWSNLIFDNGGELPNYMALGVKGFFDEGGSSLFIVRTFNYTSAGDPVNDHARGVITPPVSLPAGQLTVRARFPGLAGNMHVTFTLRAGRNALVGHGASAALTRVHEFDSVWAVSGGTGAVYVVRRATGTGEWLLNGTSSLALASADAVYPITVLVEVQRPIVDAQGLPAFGPPQAVGEFGFDPRAVGTGITTVLTANPPTRAQYLTVPIAVEGADLLASLPPGPDELPGMIAEAIFGGTILATAAVVTTPAASRQVSLTLEHGSDGNVPIVTNYEGDPFNFADYQDNPTMLPSNGLLALEPIDDVSIVAAPGASTGWADPADQAGALEISNVVITHCEKLLYRVAALDTPPKFLPGDALDYRNNRSSEYAAVYYPWITIANPLDGSRLDVPSAAYAAGIWARSDNARGVIKAPANEVVRSALDLEIRLSKAQQELLNPEGVNCFRFFPGPGFLAWGARTISDDPEWKYLNIRRYFNYLEASIDRGTQWVVFEPNGPALWDSVRHTVEGFLLTEWKSGALLGAKPEQGFFVRCDASTMTPDDLDNGRLIVLVGVSAVKPAEFVIFRISQFTATATA
jgi:Bacteriophage tail sheath protein